jgi:hypothetical protein
MHGSEGLQKNWPRLFGHRSQSRYQKMNCALKSGTQQYECFSHAKTVADNSDHIYICEAIKQEYTV